MQTQQVLNRKAAANGGSASINRPVGVSRRSSVACAATGSSQDPLLLRVARGEGAGHHQTAWAVTQNSTHDCIGTETVVDAFQH